MAVLAFLLRRHLAEGLGGPGDEKDRVVAEPGFATPLWHDLTAALALEEARLASGHRKRDDADEPRLPRPRHSLQSAQELRRSFLLSGAKARRLDARKTPQRFDLEPGIVAQRRQSGLGESGLGLQAGIFGIGLPHLVDLAVERDQLDAGVR